MKKTFYVIRHKKGAYLEPTRTTNEGKDFCNSYTVELLVGGDDPLEAWRAESEEHAQIIIQFPSPWFNAGEDSPLHRYDPVDLLVEEVTLEVAIKRVTPVIPTVEGYLIRSFGPDSLREPNPRHLEYCLQQARAGYLKEYSWHDYQWLKLKEEETLEKRRKKAVRTSTNS
jgi:hypothetical protein